MNERTLRDIAREKGTDKETVHSYAAAYERHFRHLRDRPIRLLEIGIGGYADPKVGGASLRMWKEYFPWAKIIGIDIHDKSSLAEPRITIVRGDQSDVSFLDELGATFGPFDVIIDDGSHVSSHVIASFRRLFRHLADDGIYAIEDLQTSYWESTYGGSSGPDRDGTSVSMLKSLVDGLNHAEYDIADYGPSEFDTHIRALTFYHNLAFIQKGDNTEPSNFLPPHPRPATVYRRAVSATPTRAAPRGLRIRLRRRFSETIRAAVRNLVARS